MYMRRGMFLVLCLCLLSVGAFADSVTGQFTIDVNGNPVTSQGFVTFTLESNGTIDASLTITNGANILGFGFNSLTANLSESSFSPRESFTSSPICWPTSSFTAVWDFVNPDAATSIRYSPGANPTTSYQPASLERAARRAPVSEAITETLALCTGWFCGS